MNRCDLDGSVLMVDEGVGFRVERCPWCKSETVWRDPVRVALDESMNGANR